MSHKRLKNYIFILLFGFTISIILFLDVRLILIPSFTETDLRLCMFRCDIEKAEYVDRYGGVS